MDNVYLTGPLGTQWNIGSWIDKTDSSFDWGARNLIRQKLTQSERSEGAQLGYETAAGPRSMAFPLRVPSGGIAGLSLDAIEASLREMVRPGGHVDVQPQGVPTGEMVRFDILGGDVAHTGYSVDLQRISQRQMSVTLQTQPFGYWPTWITIASVASAAPIPGVRVSIPAGSVIGDAPAQVRMVLRADRAVASPPMAQQDFLAWSLAGTPSFPNSFPAASAQSLNAIGSGAVPTFAFDASASWMSANASAAVVRASSNPGAFRELCTFPLTSNAFGRHRVLGAFRHAGGNAGTLRVMVDTTGRDTTPPAATGNQIATISAVPSLSGASYFAIYDLGELSIPVPAEASAFGSSFQGALRVWVGGASDGSVASTVVDMAGLMLLPVGGPAGVMPRGLVLPTPMVDTIEYDLMLDSSIRLVGLRGKANTSLDVGAQEPWQSGLTYYRGNLPYLGASPLTLQIYSFERYTGTSVLSDGGPPVRRNTSYVGYSVAYRPRFQFLHGI